MSNRSGRIGTDGENGLRDFLRVNGWPSAERLRPEGEHDRGDMTGTPALAWQQKSGEAAYKATDKDILDWLRATEAQRKRAGADYGILVQRRYRVPNHRAGEWWAWMWGTDAIRLAIGDVPMVLHASFDCPMRLFLGDVVHALREAGYGSPLRLVRS